MKIFAKHTFGKDLISKIYTELKTFKMQSIFSFMSKGWCICICTYAHACTQTHKGDELDRYLISTDPLSCFAKLHHPDLLHGASGPKYLGHHLMPCKHIHRKLNWNYNRQKSTTDDDVGNVHPKWQLNFTKHLQKPNTKQNQKSNNCFSTGHFLKQDTIVKSR